MPRSLCGKCAKQRFMQLFELDKTYFLTEFEKYMDSVLSSDESVLDVVARYVARFGGKRIRVSLVYLGAQAAGGNCDVQGALSLAAGVELIHNYSLVHDDLPAMDNAATRRGKPSAHAAFGEANGILGGDILLTYAMDELLKGCQKYGGKFALAAAELSSAAAKMAHGQANELSGMAVEEQMLKMYSYKTGALILGALKAGAIYAGADEKTLANIVDYGKALGVVFQLSDDLIDGDGLVKISGRERTEYLLKKHFNLACCAACAAGDNRELMLFARQMAYREK